MKPLENNTFSQDEDQADVLEGFAPRVRELIMAYRDKRQLTSIAERMGFHGTRLTEMISANGDGNYKRKITPYYLAKFLDAGIMDVSDILQGRTLDDLSERQRIFFERMILPRKTLQLVIETKRRGIDLEKILEAILYPKGT